MDKAQRDAVAVQMLEEAYDDTLEASDIADAFFASHNTPDVDPVDRLAWMVGYLGMGMEYLRRTGVVGIPSDEQKG